MYCGLYFGQPHNGMSRQDASDRFEFPMRLITISLITVS